MNGLEYAFAIAIVLIVVLSWAHRHDRDVWHD